MDLLPVILILLIVVQEIDCMMILLSIQVHLM